MKGDVKGDNKACLIRVVGWHPAGFYLAELVSDLFFGNVWYAQIKREEALPEGEYTWDELGVKPVGDYRRLRNGEMGLGTRFSPDLKLLDPTRVSAALRSPKEPVIFMLEYVEHVKIEVKDVPEQINKSDPVPAREEERSGGANRVRTRVGAAKAESKP